MINRPFLSIGGLSPACMAHCTNTPFMIRSFLHQWTGGTFLLDRGRPRKAIEINNLTEVLPY